MAVDTGAGMFLRVFSANDIIDKFQGEFLGYIFDLVSFLIDGAVSMSQSS